MMRDGFPAIEKEGDLVAGEDALDGLMVALQVSHQHGRLAITSPGPDVAQDFARRQPDLSVRVEAGGEAQGLLDAGYWILDAGRAALDVRYAGFAGLIGCEYALASAQYCSRCCRTELPANRLSLGRRRSTSTSNSTPGRACSRDSQSSKVLRTTDQWESQEMFPAGR